MRTTLRTSDIITGAGYLRPTRWTDESERAKLLAPALAKYRGALEITSAPGIVQDALRDLELIRAAGIEGLEPAFELLETTLETAQREVHIDH